MTSRPRHRLAAAALGLIVAVSAAADLLPHGPSRVRTEQGVEVLRPPSARHWLGTDDRGRDVAARLAHGTRASLLVAAAALLVALVAGATAGAGAAVLGPVADAAVVGGCDLVGALPPLMLAVAAQGLIGRATFASLVVLIALPQAAYIARVARVEVQRAMAAPFAEAARASGATPWRVALRHALPHAAPQLRVAAAVTLSTAVLSEAALSFVGLGVPGDVASLGELLRQAHQTGLIWWLAVPSGGAVAAIALAADALGT